MSESLDILRVSQWHYPEEVGGGAYHVHALSRDQAKKGHDVTVLTMSSDESKPTKEQVDGYTVIRYRPIGSPMGNEIAPKSAKKILKQDDFDVIHAHSHFYLITNLAALARKLNNVPLAITNHSLYSQSAPERLFSLYLRTLGRWTLNSADKIFCYTKEEMKKTREIGVETEIDIIPNGIDHTRFTPDGDTAEMIQRSEGSPKILFVGRLVDGKCPSVALEAFSLIKKHKPNAQLYFCGDGPLRDELVSESHRLEIADAVHFLDHVSYSKMPGVYRAADTLILPSRAEGVPRTVMEALASETPVVVSNLQQLKPLVDGCGYTAEVGSPESFSGHLLECLEETEELGKRGRRKVIENHSWQDTVHRTSKSLISLSL